MTDPTEKATEVLARTMANASGRRQEPYVFRDQARVLLAEIAPLLVAEEREACAKVADGIGCGRELSVRDLVARRIAAAIRGRGRG